MEDAVAITVRAFRERELGRSLVRRTACDPLSASGRDRVSECNCYQLFAVSKRSQLYRGR
jgi:hypothetical protein